MSIPSSYAYRNLIVWQRSMELLKKVYELTDQLPDQGPYGLRAEMRKIAFVIPTNIAAGRMRGTKSAYVQSLRTAYAAGASMETAIALMLDIGPETPIDCTGVSGMLDEVMKMLGALLRTLTMRSKKPEEQATEHAPAEAVVA